MRKYLLSVLLVLAMFAGIFALYPRKSAPIHADTLVGGDTLLFLHCPDIAQSRERWRKTALHAIAQEPDVREFLTKPKAHLGSMGTNQTYLKALRGAAPREAFLAATPLPFHWVAGALCLGDKGKLESAFLQAAHDLQRSWREGQISRSRHKGVDLEILADQQTTLASAWVGRWVFVSNDLDLLKTTIDRAQGTVSSVPLRDNPKFKKALAHLPADSEFVAFAQPSGSFATCLPASLQECIPPYLLNSLKRCEAVSAGIKFDGEDIRDAVFAAIPPCAHPLPLATLSRQTLRRTTEDSLLYFEGLMNWQGLFQSLAALPNPGEPKAGVSSRFAEIKSGLSAQGINSSNCAGMLGAEFGLVVDWPPQALEPSPTLSLELLDPPLAQKTVELLVSGTLGNTAWQRTQEGDAEVFHLPILPVLTPTLAIKANQLAIGLDPKAVLASLQPHPKEGGLAKLSAFTETSGRLSKPTSAFGYVDAKTLFERLYGLSRPLLMLWGGIHPGAREFIDVSKLPSTESISEHLKPIAYSARELPDGFLAESVGTITFTQSALGLGVGAGAALAPWAKTQFLSGTRGTPSGAEGGNGTPDGI